MSEQETILHRSFPALAKAGLVSVKPPKTRLRGRTVAQWRDDNREKIRGYHRAAYLRWRAKHPRKNRPTTIGLPESTKEERRAYRRAYYKLYGRKRKL